LRIALSVKTAVLMIAGEDGGGGLLPLLLPPRECDISSLNTRCLGDQRGESRGPVNRVKALGARYDANMFTNYYYSYS